LPAILVKKYFPKSSDYSLSGLPFPTHVRPPFCCYSILNYSHTM
jgi:hypothetical protein